jgi:DNA modification methylase
VSDDLDLLGQPIGGRRGGRRFRHLDERRHHVGQTHVRLILGDVRAALAALPSASVHCVVTSPPYYGLRDYGTDPQVWSDGWHGSLGLEPTPNLYIKHLVEVFREVRRVLRDDGTCFIVIGDSYASGGRSTYRSGASDNKGHVIQNDMPRPVDPPGIKPKDIVGVPWMLAFALRADGWYLRQDIIWNKPSTMPESVTDRCTKSHEYVFLLTKRERYFFDNKAIKEDAGQPIGRPMMTGQHKQAALGRELSSSTLGTNEGNAMRNCRSVWTIASEPLAEPHFAAFPSELVAKCILAGTSTRGVCPRCGAPWIRQVERIDVKEYRYLTIDIPGEENQRGCRDKLLENSQYVASGKWLSSCRCDAGDPVPATVLDPFVGSGTTAIVAAQLGCDAVGIDISPAYVDMARRRVEADTALLGLSRVTVERVDE